MLKKKRNSKLKDYEIILQLLCGAEITRMLKVGDVGDGKPKERRKEF